MKQKTFDCVEMKRRGAARVQTRLAGTTRGERLRYWQERTQALLKRQQEARQGRRKA